MEEMRSTTIGCQQQMCTMHYTLKTVRTICHYHWYCSKMKVHLILVLALFHWSSQFKRNTPLQYLSVPTTHCFLRNVSISCRTISSNLSAVSVHLHVCEWVYIRRMIIIFLFIYFRSCVCVYCACAYVRILVTILVCWFVWCACMQCNTNRVRVCPVSVP